MKRYIYLGTVIASMLIIFASCSKNTRVINRLEGNWKLISQTDANLFNVEMTTEYKKCKRSDETCSGVSTIVNSEPGFESTTTVNFHYTVEEKGTKLTQTTESFDDGSTSVNCTGDCTTVSTIVENDKNEMIFEHTNDSGKVITTVIQRM